MSISHKNGVALTTLSAINGVTSISAINGISATLGSAGITFESASSSNYFFTRSPTVNKPSVAANDIMMAFFTTSSNHDTGGTPPTGWTKLFEQDIFSRSSLSAFWKRAAAGESASDTWTNIFNSSATGIAVVVAYRGCTTSGSPIDAHASSAGGFSAVHAQSVTTTVANAMVVGCVGTRPGANPTTATWTSPIDERIDSNTTPTGQDGTNGYITIGDIIKATAGAQNMEVTLSIATQYGRAAISLKPA